jgi:HAD superfamily phosphatase (TIGR01668 family)
MSISKYFPYEYENDVFTIPYTLLYKSGIRGLIFDIDNTLVPHGKDTTPEVDALFRRLHGIGFATLLLSNNSVERIERFNVNIGTKYVADAEKPSPKGYMQALEILGLAPHEVVVIGDQVFTDVWAARNAKMRAILLPPIKDKTDIFTKFKRLLEKPILKKYERKKRNEEK